jgi:hypothetical protein
MKKILGLAVLMMVILVSVSGLAQVEDSVDVPVYLNVPQFVSIEASPATQKFELEFDLATEQATSDTVTLWAEANVSYTVSYQKFAVTTNLPSGMTQGDVNAWVSLLTILLTPTGGSAGTQTITATAALDFSSIVDLNGNNSTYDEILKLGTVPADTHIADVTFTISAP